MLYLKFVLRSEIQFVYPNPKACLAVRQWSKLIFFTPFRAGVNGENEFAD
jgi:hypothetical protein